MTTILSFQNPNRTLMSLESETNLSSAGLGLEAPTTLEQVSSSMYLSKSLPEFVRVVTCIFESSIGLGIEAPSTLEKVFLLES